MSLQQNVKASPGNRVLIVSKQKLQIIPPKVPAVKNLQPLILAFNLTKDEFSNGFNFFQS